jgi:hypothetical protein
MNLKHLSKSYKVVRQRRMGCVSGLRSVDGSAAQEKVETGGFGFAV